MKQVPTTELQEVKDVLFRLGIFRIRELDEMTNHLASNPKAMLEFMMAFELKLAPVEKNEARRSLTVVLSSTIFGSIVPLIPFLFVTGGTILSGTIASVILSGAVLFFIGAYKKRRSCWINMVERSADDDHWAFRRFRGIPHRPSYRGSARLNAW